MAVRVPDTNTYSLLDVYNAVKDHAVSTTGDLSDCFSKAISGYFDPTYNANAYALPNSLKRFRNYGPSGPVLVVKVLFDSGNWVCPVGVSEIRVHAIGGGGAGSEATGLNANGGGGGGAYARKDINVTPSTSYAYSVGGGGNAYNGSPSYFLNSSTVFAAGGKAAGGGVPNINEPTGGLGGSAADSVGDVVYSGGNGGDGVAGNYSGGGGGAAGANGNGVAGSGATGGSGDSYEYSGKGATGVTIHNARNHGELHGGGGSGAFSTSGASLISGGAGGLGIIVLEYYQTI